MDLSGMIFVVLAIGWAVYLIPKALQHQDEMSLSRSVESFSDSVRVLGRKRSAVPAAPVSSTPAVERPAFVISRAAARKAAQRRRRVLGVLLLVLLATTATSWSAVTPWWSTAVPGALIVGFLLVARSTVRKQVVRRAVPTPTALTTDELHPDLTRENTTGVSRDELAAAVAAPALDEGGLWDPLPVTLPTYVSKARAHRTVRTIELTQTGVTSSGHDEADSELAAQAQAQAPEASDVADDRRAAGA